MTKFWQDYLRKLWRGFTTMRMVLTGLGMGRVEFDIAHPDLQGLVELVCFHVLRLCSSHVSLLTLEKRDPR